jgi:diacylglycerol kinase
LYQADLRYLNLILAIMKAGEHNNQINKFNIGVRLKSFKNAFSGLSCLVKYEHNARIHIFILIIALLAGIFLRISFSDWIAIILATGLVFTSECFNTAVEYLSDAVSEDYNEKIKKAKDVASAGVMISAIISVIIGLIVFLPEIYRLLVV